MILRYGDKIRIIFGYGDRISVVFDYGDSLASFSVMGIGLD